jgi:hypothetical protein
MDVDETENQAAGPLSADAEAAVAELGGLLTQLEIEPNNTHLLRRQIDLFLQAGMVKEAADAATTTSQLSFLGEALWRRVLDGKIASLPTPVTLDDLVEVLDLFQAAEGEYLCKSSSPIEIEADASAFDSAAACGLPRRPHRRG